MEELRMQLVLVVLDGDAAKKRYTFKVPVGMPPENFRPGTRVKVKTRKGEKEGRIACAPARFMADESAFQFMLTATGTTLPIQPVTHIIKEIPLEYNPGYVRQEGAAVAYSSANDITAGSGYGLHGFDRLDD